MSKEEGKWLLCPVCNSKTRIRIREDTEMKKFLLFCPKCKQEKLVNFQDGVMTLLEKESN